MGFVTRCGDGDGDGDGRDRRTRCDKSHWEIGLAQIREAIGWFGGRSDVLGGVRPGAEVHSVSPRRS